MRIILVYVFLLTAILLATGNLWGPLETSEARYAEISREMLVSGDWLHPTLLNIYHYHKPPVTYWITAASYSLFGVSPFALRFFLVVALVVQFFLVAKISKMLLNDEETSVLAGWIYITMPLVLASVRGLTTDAYMMTFVLAGIFSWIKLITNGNAVFLYCSAISFGLAFLTKGPVALVLPVVAVISLFQWRSIPALKSVHWILALVIFLVISLSWFLLLVSENKDFIRYFIFNHTINRITNAEVFSRSEPFYYYLLFMPLLALPWIIPFLLHVFKTTGTGTVIKSIVFYWVGIPLLFFSIVSSKLPLYILPLFPGISIAAAFYLKKKSFHGLKLIYLMVNTLLAGILLYTALVIFKDQSADGVLYTAVYILIGSWVIYFLFPEGLVLNSLVFNLISGLLISSIFVFSSGYSSDVNTAVLGKSLQEKRINNEPILVFDELLPSLAFHLNEVPVSVYNGARSLQREVSFQSDSSWKNYLINFTSSEGQEQVKRHLNNSALVVIRKDKFGYLAPFISEVHKVDTAGTRLIIYSSKNESSN